MPQVAAAWDPVKIMKRYSRKRVFRTLDARLTARQKQQLRKAFDRLDREFLLEKIDVVKDTMLEIARNKSTTPNTLLQRNVWSSLDSIGMHLDETGFTPVFQGAAVRLFKDVRLDDPLIITAEHEALLAFLGMEEAEAGRLDLGLAEVQTIMRLAEEEKQGHCGLSNIAREDFSFREVFAKFCGRPDKILEVHHSPQKGPFVIILGVLNLAFAIAGIVSLIGWWAGIIFAVITVIVIVIIGCTGC